MDTYYVMPTGQRIKVLVSWDKFLKANPEYKDRISPADFNFATPKVDEETVSVWKPAAANAKAKKQDKVGASRGQK